MKFVSSVFTKILIFIFCTALGITILLFATGNQYIIRGIGLTYLKGRTTAGIYDYKDFDNRVIFKGKPAKWQLHSDYNRLQLTDTLRSLLETYETDAFVVIKDGKLIIEEYWNGRKSNDLSNSFSMAKTYVAMLLFKAIENGDIKSLNQPITDFIPEFKGDSFGNRCTVGDLAAMTSGFDWQENYYLPLNPTAKAYFGADIEQQMLDRSFIAEPGGHFVYLSGNTQLLGIVLQRATGKNLSTLLAEQFWEPLGMEEDALWSLDGNAEMEKAYCCVNATAKDFAKIGQLFLQQGNWQGRQLMDSADVQQMISPNAEAFYPGEIPHYGYSVWMDYSHSPAFYAFLGHLGQRTIVVPDENLVIVRLGKQKDNRMLQNRPMEGTATDAYYMIEEVLKMLN